MVEAKGWERAGCKLIGFDESIEAGLAVRGIRDDRAAIEAWQATLSSGDPKFTGWVNAILGGFQEGMEKKFKEVADSPPATVTDSALWQRMINFVAAVFKNDIDWTYRIFDNGQELLTYQKNPAQCKAAEALGGIDKPTFISCNKPQCGVNKPCDPGKCSIQAAGAQHFIARPDIFSISNHNTRCYLCNIPVYDNTANSVWHWDCEHVLPFLQGGFMLALAGTVAYEKSLAPVNQAERHRLFNLEYKWSHGLCNQLKNQAQFFGMGYVVQGNMVTLNYVIQESLIDLYLDALFDDATKCNAWNKWKEEWGVCFNTDPETIKGTLKDEARKSILQTLEPIQNEFNTIEATKDYNVNHDGKTLTLRINFTKGALKHLSSLFTAHVMRAWRTNPNEWTTWVAPGTPVVPTTPVATGATPIQTILNTNGQPAVVAATVPEVQRQGSFGDTNCSFREAATAICVSLADILVKWFTTSSGSSASPSASQFGRTKTKIRKKLKFGAISLPDGRTIEPQDYLLELVGAWKIAYYSGQRTTEPLQVLIYTLKNYINFIAPIQMCVQIAPQQTIEGVVGYLQQLKACVTNTEYDIANYLLSLSNDDANKVQIFTALFGQIYLSSNLLMQQGMEQATLDQAFRHLLDIMKQDLLIIFTAVEEAIKQMLATTPSQFGRVRHNRKHSYSEQQIKLAKKLRIKLDKNINDNINKVLRVHAIAKKLRINLTTQNSKNQRIYKTPAKLISEIKSKLKR